MAQVGVVVLSLKDDPIDRLAAPSSSGEPRMAGQRAGCGMGPSGVGLVGRVFRCMNIVVSNLKGGVGKSTTAVYLAAAAASRGYDPVLLIDADRQASTAEWFEQRPIDGVTLVEAPSERTVSRAMSRNEGLAVIDTPPGDQRIVEAALAAADAVVVPTRAGGVEISRVLVTLEMIKDETPRGLVICAARLGTNDLVETLAWWKEQKVPVWGVIPERVGIASGPEARLFREGLEDYDAVLRHALRAKRR